VKRIYPDTRTRRTRSSTFDVAGRAALITGAGQGIGLQVARTLYDRGASVALVDLDVGRLDAVVRELDPERALAIGGDVRDREAMAAAVQLAAERFRSLDVVVANAGVAPVAATLRTMDADDFDRVVAVNLTGVFNTVHPAIEPVIAAGGHIVVVASAAAFLPGPAGSAYMITKAGVEQLGRALRIELAPHGASAGVAYFGIVQTAMTRDTLDEDPLGGEMQRQLPAALRRRITAAQAGEVIADGIRRRAPRTIAPRAWSAAALLRGLGGLLDWRIAGDATMRRVLASVEGRAALEGVADGRGEGG
jgi:NAD(P)-dependent dehydrogenase (short-subunit alcohol dehydrogenase family)